MSRYNLAQLNVARMKFPLEAPEMADFVASLERINALADRSPGFVWRLQTEEGDATGIDFFGPGVLVNMSVWTDLAPLHDYVYRSAHAGVMRRRKEWFQRMAQGHTVLWWIPEGATPTLQEARDRLERLRKSGPTAAAFTFKKPFPAPGAGAPATREFEDLCPAS